jgi:hypothetical protein
VSVDIKVVAADRLRAEERPVELMHGVECVAANKARSRADRHALVGQMREVEEVERQRLAMPLRDRSARFR